MTGALCIWRGQRLYQIAPAYKGVGFIGLCDGRVVATAKDRAGVMRMIINSGRRHLERAASRSHHVLAGAVSLSVSVGDARYTS